MQLPDSTASPKIIELTQATSSELFLPGHPVMSEKKQTILLVCDCENLFRELRNMFGRCFHVVAVTNPMDGLVTMKTINIDQVVIAVEQLRASLWVMLRSMGSRTGQNPVPVLLFSPDMEGNQIQKAYRSGALFCSNNILSGQEIFNQLIAFTAYHERLKQHILNRAGLHDGLLHNKHDDQLLLDRLNRIIKTNYNNPSLSIDELTKLLGMSISSLERKCMQLTGMPPKAYLTEFRLLNAYKLIEQGHKSIFEACTSVGFSNSSYFSTKFVARFGIKPSDLIRKVGKTG